MNASRTFKPYLLCDTVSTAAPGVCCLAVMQTGTLVDGTHVFVVENKTLYVLDKESADDPTGGLIAAVGGGNWIPNGSIGASAGALNLINALSKAASLTGTGNFVSLTPASNSYTRRFGGSGWSISTTTGIATWAGPSDSNFAVVATASMQNDTADIETLMGLSVTGSPVEPFQGIQQANHVPGGSAFYELTLAGIVAIGQGDTLELKFAGGNSNILVTKLSLLVTPLS